VPVQADSEYAQEKYNKLKTNWKILEKLELWSFKRFPEFIVRR